MGSRICGAIENPIKLLYVSKITTISKASFKKNKATQSGPFGDFFGNSYSPKATCMVVAVPVGVVIIGVVVVVSSDTENTSVE